MRTQSEIENDIKNFSWKQAEARKIVDNLKRQWTDAETVLIQYNLTVEKLQDELRRVRNSTYVEETSAKDKEIARFAEVLPELLKRNL